jgi:hypothetical protein
MTKVVLSPGQNDALRTLEIFCRLVPSPLLEPIQEVLIQRQRFDLVKRWSIMRIMARRMKAATVLA